jgi:GTP-binding protein EngB required for normal cell division
MDRGSYSDARGELARSLKALAALAQVDQDACAWLRNKLREEVFNLVAVGQFKRGKSSVINALLGEALLPVGVVPLTSVVTEIRYGPEPSAEVVYESGARHQVGIDSLADYVTEKGNPRNVKGVREVLIRFPSMWLESGVRLVDTPGIGSVYEHNTDVTQRYLPQADAVLFVGSVDQPMSRAELEFLESIRPYAAKIFCLLNKTDYLSAKELEESLAFSARAIETALGVAIPLYPVSARLALAAKCESDAAGQARSGFSPFERMLLAFMTDDKELIWLKSIAQSSLRILAQARLQVNLELAALAAPLEQVERNLVAFIHKKQETLTTRAEYCVLIEANARDLQKQQVEPALDRFKREQQSRAIGLIDQ